VQQLAADGVQASFLSTAWQTLLGRFAAATNNKGRQK
jgi:hypothetical protein